MMPRTWQGCLGTQGRGRFCAWRRKPLCKDYWREFHRRDERNTFMEDILMAKIEATQKTVLELFSGKAADFLIPDY